MQFARTLRFLSLPAAIALGTALAVACSDGVPTSPDQAFGPSFAPKKTGGGGSYDAVGSDPAQCGSGYYLTTVSNWGSGADANGDGFICKKGTPKKQ